MDASHNKSELSQRGKKKKKSIFQKYLFPKYNIRYNTPWNNILYSITTPPQLFSRILVCIFMVLRLHGYTTLKVLLLWLFISSLHISERAPHMAQLVERYTMYGGLKSLCTPAQVWVLPNKLKFILTQLLFGTTFSFQVIVKFMAWCEGLVGIILLKEFTSGSTSVSWQMAVYLPVEMKNSYLNRWPNLVCPWGRKEAVTSLCLNTGIISIII